MVGRPAERAQGRDGAEDVEAVRDPQDDHQEAGDARRPGATEQGSERERQAAEEQGHEAGPEGEADRRQEWDLVAEGGVAEQRRAGRGDDGEDRHRQGQHRHVSRQLLERDPALAEGRRRDEVEAAAAGLAGEGRGEGEDRPERGAEGEDRPVLEGHVAAEGAEVHGLPEEVDHRGGHAPDELVHLEARPRRREDARHGRTHEKRHPAEQAGGDDEGEPGVADRLAVDAPEAVQATVEGDRGEGRRDRRLPGANGHGCSPRRPRGRTGQGTSPRGSALSRRSRGARSGRRPGRPG